MSDGELQGVERRVHHPDVVAARLAFERAAVAAGHPHHVAECREDRAVPLHERQPFIDSSHRQHADRAARTVDQLDIGGQQVGEGKAVDRVGVAAADLHDPVVP